MYGEWKRVVQKELLMQIDEFKNGVPAIPASRGQEIAAVVDGDTAHLVKLGVFASRWVTLGGKSTQRQKVTLNQSSMF